MATRVRPTTAEQTLYVMQCEHGPIKLGRSVDPERRRAALEREHKCKVALVALFPATGHEEERVLIRSMRIGSAGSGFRAR
jgi:hypothetical protein